MPFPIIHDIIYDDQANSNDIKNGYLNKPVRSSFCRRTEKNSMFVNRAAAFHLPNKRIIDKEACQAIKKNRAYCFDLFKNTKKIMIIARDNISVSSFSLLYFSPS